MCNTRNRYCWGTYTVIRKSVILKECRTADLYAYPPGGRMNPQCRSTIASGFVSSSSLVFPHAWNLSSFAWLAYLPIGTTTSEQIILRIPVPHPLASFFFAVPRLLHLHPITSVVHVTYFNRHGSVALPIFPCCAWRLCTFPNKFAPCFKRHSFTHGQSIIYIACCYAYACGIVRKLSFQRLRRTHQTVYTNLILHSTSPANKHKSASCYLK